MNSQTYEQWLEEQKNLNNNDLTLEEVMAALNRQIDKYKLGKKIRKRNF